MFAFLIIATLAGMGLGLRFNVLVLVPAILLAITVVTLTDIANRQNVRMILLTVFATVVLLQVGYIAGRVLKLTAQAQSLNQMTVRYPGSDKLMSS
jgi:hypothetical protein